MEAFISIFKNVLIFIALAVPGFILVKTKILKSSETGALSKLLTYVGMPFLILTGTMDISLDTEFALTSVVTLVGCVIVTLGMCFLSAPLTNKFKSKPGCEGDADDKKRGIMRFAMTYSNNGFLGIPLAIAVFGNDSIAVTIVTIINIVTNLGIYTFGIYMISGDKKAMNLKKAFLNPVLISFVIGVIFNVLNVKSLFKESYDYSVYLKNLVTPVSMIIIGMKLADIKFKTLFTSKSGLYVYAIKLIALPILATAIAFGLTAIFPALPKEIIIAFLVAFAMPTAALASTFADAYGGDTENAVIYTLGSTIFSVATISLLYTVVDALVKLI